MKDSKFIQNKFQRGISKAELYGEENRHGGGVPTHGGVKKETEFVAGLGVPMHGDGPISPYVVETDCHGITVKGEPCKAYRVKGEELCIGHLNGQRRNT